MSEPTPVEDLASEALVAVLAGEGENSFAPSSLSARAREGHSPSARALVNASDLVTALALTASPVEPSDALRARVLASAASRLRGAPEVDRPSDVETATERAPRILAPCEMIAQLHEKAADEVSRRERIESFGVAGVLGGVQAAVDDDKEIAALLARMAPFVEPGALFVSVVRAGQTIHRVHRGFPEQFGNVDIVPRQTSFCTHCVSADAPLVVHDAASEAFFRSAVVVQTFSARTYIGVPIRVGGIGVGALCTIGFFRPRHVSRAELQLFETFAPHAEAIVAKDKAACHRIRPEGLYTSELFMRLLDLEILKTRATVGPPSLAIVPIERRALVTEEDLAARISETEIAVLLGPDHGTSGARLGATRVVPLSDGIAHGSVWLERARG